MTRDRREDMPKDGADRQPSPGPFRDAAADQPRAPAALDRTPSAASDARAAEGQKPYTTEHENYTTGALKRPDHPDHRAAARVGTPVDPAATTGSEPPPADPATEGSEEKAP